MSNVTVKFIDASGGVLATASAADEGTHYWGTIDLRLLPADLRALFDEFEEIVNNQMLSFLDDIQRRIASLPIRAILNDACEVSITDLQVYPSTKEVSFKLACLPAPTV